jgi:hypothetical protein
MVFQNFMSVCPKYLIHNSLSTALTALLPSLDTFLTESTLLPLTQRLQQVQQFDLSTFQAELKTAGSFMNSKVTEEDKNDLWQIALSILPYKEAFQTLYLHYAAALTIRGFNCHCEHIFLSN